MQESTLSYPALTLNFILTILPYYILYKIYIHFKIKYRSKYKVSISILLIEKITILINIVYLILVWKYNIGKAFADVYSAPPVIKIIIQIILRLSPLLWLNISFFISESKIRTTIYGIFLILFAVLMGYFSIFISILFMIVLKYNQYWIPILRKYYLILIATILLSAPVLELGYTYRDLIRGTQSNVSNMDGTSLIIGKFCGRLSPFPNSSIILQRETTYRAEAEKLPVHFFLKSMLNVIHSSFKLDYPPEKILSGSKETDYVSFMCGTTGIIYFAAYNSIFSLLLTIFLILIIDITVFKILSLFKFNLRYEIAFYILLGPTMSGVGKEYFAQLWGLLVILIICIFIRSVRTYIIRSQNKVLITNQI